MSKLVCLSVRLCVCLSAWLLACLVGLSAVGRLVVLSLRLSFYFFLVSFVLFDVIKYFLVV